MQKKAGFTRQRFLFYTQAIGKVLNGALHKAKETSQKGNDRLSGSTTAQSPNEPSKSVIISKKTSSAQ